MPNACRIVGSALVVATAATSLAVGVVIESVAVGFTTAAFVKHGNQSLVVTPEIVLPVQRRGEAVTDGVTGACLDFLVGLEHGNVAEVRARGRAGQWTDFGS